MRLIGLAVVLTLSLTLPTLAAEAQETANKAHVGVLLLTPRAGAGGTYIEALRGGLRELGYVEGQNLLLEIRSVPPRFWAWTAGALNALTATVAPIPASTCRRLRRLMSELLR